MKSLANLREDYWVNNKNISCSMNAPKGPRAQRNRGPRSHKILMFVSKKTPKKNTELLLVF